MLIRIVKLSVESTRLDEFMKLFNLSKDKIRNFDGCRQLELLCVTEEKNILFTYSTWDSERHLQKYLQSEVFKSTWEQVKPLFCEKPEAWSLEKVITV